MVVIGVAYLAFEKTILVSSAPKNDSVAPAKNPLSRALIGVQVGSSLI
jgi:hypothetical protein